jgi:hypothetical protein
MWIRAFAQADDDDMDMENSGRGARGTLGSEELDGMLDYYPIRFTTRDLMTVLFLIITCYVFGKIWKGCSYLILILAAIFYYMLH